MNRLLAILFMSLTVLAAVAASPVSELNRVADELELNEDLVKTAYFTEKRDPETKTLISQNRYIEFNDPEKTYHAKFSKLIKELRPKASSYQVYDENGRRCYHIIIPDGDGKITVNLTICGRKSYLIQISATYPTPSRNKSQSQSYKQQGKQHKK